MTIKTCQRSKVTRNTRKTSSRLTVSDISHQIRLLNPTIRQAAPLLNNMLYTPPPHEADMEASPYSVPNSESRKVTLSSIYIYIYINVNFDKSNLPDPTCWKEQGRTRAKPCVPCSQWHHRYLEMANLPTTLVVVHITFSHKVSVGAVSMATWVREIYHGSIVVYFLY